MKKISKKSTKVKQEQALVSLDLKNSLVASEQVLVSRMNPKQ